MFAEGRARHARVAKNRVQKLDAHLAHARRSKHCNDTRRRRKVAGGCLVALWGRCGAIDGRNGRFVTENQYKISHQHNVFVHVVCIGG